MALLNKAEVWFTSSPWWCPLIVPNLEKQFSNLTILIKEGLIINNCMLFKFELKKFYKLNLALFWKYLGWFQYCFYILSKNVQSHSTRIMSTVCMDMEQSITLTIRIAKIRSSNARYANVTAKKSIIIA